MGMKGKKYVQAKARVDRNKRYELEEGLKLVTESSYAGFDESVDVAIRLGVDPRKADQMVRGTVLLPHGTGKTVRVLAFAKGQKEKEALDAGADYAGGDELVEKISGGWIEFDKAVATPDMMSSVGKLGKILGPRGLMPNPKVGTVTFDIEKAVTELKSGKVEFRVEKAGIVHIAVGKVSLGIEKLQENIKVLLDVIIRAKPPTSKGVYMKSIALSTTMGPGVKIEPSSVRTAMKSG
jgi:large subunit ribosomal protein L1